MTVENSKVMNVHEAISKFVHDGDELVIGNCTVLIPPRWMKSWIAAREKVTPNNPAIVLAVPFDPE